MLHVVLLFHGKAYSRFIGAIHMLQTSTFHMSIKHKDVLKVFAPVQCSPFRNNFPETDLQTKIIKYKQAHFYSIFSGVKIYSQKLDILFRNIYG